MSAPRTIPPQRILVVDDEITVLDAVEMLLTFEGHSVIRASSGPEALQKMDSQKFSLVITDYCMPHMDGAQFALAAKQRAPELPIIMLTAFPPASTPPGIDLILTKPFLLESLRTAMTRVLEPAASMR